MSVLRQVNWLGSMRVDVTHLRLLEASIVGDAQALSGTILAGNRALVAWGAVILDSGAVGTPASSLLLRMAGSSFLHATAQEPGTVFIVAPGHPDDVLNGTNSNVVGSFTPGVHQVNYVSIDLERITDPTTQDAVVFRSGSTGQEFTQVVPLGRVLQYRIHITTSDFSTTPTYCPIAKVTLDPSGNVEIIVDCRQMYWRLGSGGSTPDALAQYVWTNRLETTTGSAFTGGDKDIASQGEFNRAIMQRMWELGGGEHWYSPADDRSVQLTYDNSSVFALTGENWYWNGTDLLWRGLSYWMANSTASENLVLDVTVATPGLTDLVDGQLIYVELNRAANVTITPVKSSWGALFSLPPSTPGSRHILAWRQHGRVYVGQNNIVVNTGGVHASNTSFGSVKLFTSFAPDAPNPVVPVMDAVFSATPTDPANVVARGITRDLNGILAIGGGVHDTEVDVSQTGVLTKILGTLSVTGLATLNGGIALTGQVTRNNLPTVGQQLSATSGAFVTSSLTDVSVTNLSVTITTTGRPVFVALQGTSGTVDPGSYIGCLGASSAGIFSLFRGATNILMTQITGNTGAGATVPPSALSIIDTPAAGTYTYTVKVHANLAPTQVFVYYTKLIAYEL